MSTDFNAKYILNPGYVLRADKDRIILASRKDADHSHCVFVHPVWAIALSYFDGANSLNETIKLISAAIQIPEHKLIYTITPFIENEGHFCMEYDHQKFWFPEQIIVRNEKEEKRADINVKSLLIAPPYDFDTFRLNIPLSVMLVVNTKCVTDCIYCYADKETKHGQMSLEKILDLIDEAYASEIKGFDLSGGEIFTCKGWDLILEKLYERGYNPYISTKVPLTKGDVNRLYEVGARQVQISLDSLDPALLRETLKVPEDYGDRMKATITDLSKRGVSVIVKSVLTRKTCTTENLRQMIGFLETVPGICQYTYTPAGYSHYKSVEDFDAFKPTMDQVVDMEEYFENLQQSLPHFRLRRDTGAVSDGAECCNARVFNKRAICSGNVYEMVILPDGQATICEELYWNPDFIIGDVTKNSILEVWQSDRAMSLWKLNRTVIPAESACHDCNDFEACRYHEGVCWKELIAVYGKENRLFPDYRCPRAPKPIRPVFYDNSFIFENKN